MNYECQYSYKADGVPPVIKGFNHFITIPFEHPMLKSGPVSMIVIDKYVSETIACQRFAEDLLKSNGIQFKFFDGSTLRWAFRSKTDAMRFKLMMS